MKIKIKEKDIQRQIIDYLTIKHIFFYRQNSGALKTERGGFVHFGATGSPDIVLVINGIYVGIEVKNATARLTDAQEAFQKALERAGGKYFVARSLDDVINLLKKLSTYQRKKHLTDKRCQDKI